jgi:hypothetical protein
VLLSARCRTAAALHRLHARLSSLESASLRAVSLIEVAVAITLGSAAGSVTGIGAGTASAVLLLLGLLPRGRRLVLRRRQEGVAQGLQPRT